jgi:hypothetical protein
MTCEFSEAELVIEVAILAARCDVICEEVISILQKRMVRRTSHLPVACLYIPGGWCQEVITRTLSAFPPLGSAAVPRAPVYDTAVAEPLPQLPAPPLL